MQADGYGSGLTEGMRVLYWAPGTPRTERVLATVEEMPTGTRPLYVLDVDDGRRVEASWFSVEPARVQCSKEPW